MVRGGERERVRVYECVRSFGYLRSGGGVGRGGGVGGGAGCRCSVRAHQEQVWEQQG